MSQMSLGPSDGRMTITAVLANPLRRSTRSVTLTMTEWGARIHFDAEQVRRIEVEVSVASMAVSEPGPGSGSAGSGSGSLSEIDRTLIRRTVLASLSAERAPTATFVSTMVNRSGLRYQVTGDANIAGRSGTTQVLVDVTDTDSAWSVVGELELRHTDFGISPPAVLGAFKAPGQVTVRLDAAVDKPAR